MEETGSHSAPRRDFRTLVQTERDAATGVIGGSPGIEKKND